MTGATKLNRECSPSATRPHTVSILITVFMQPAFEAFLPEPAVLALQPKRILPVHGLLPPLLSVVISSGRSHETVCKDAAELSTSERPPTRAFLPDVVLVLPKF